MKTLAKTIIRNNPLPVPLQEKLMFFGKCGYWPDFENPRSFNEKVNWRKLHSTDSRFATLCDKLAVREYVREKIGASHLIPLLFQGDSIAPEQLIALGNDIVVKANHDSGSVVIIRENTPEAAARACEKIAGSLRRNYGEETREWWYARVKPRVFVEPFLSDDIGSRPFDVKFFVFRSPNGGSPRAIIEVDHERGTADHHRTFYDETGNVLTVDGQGVRIDSEPNHCVPFPRPEHLEEMRRLAFKLAEDFDHVRVDLYNINGHTYFGELTFSDGGGRSRWSPRSFDFQLGELWDLDLVPGGTDRPEPGGEVVKQVYLRQDPLRRWKHRATLSLKRLGDRAGVFLGRLARFFALPYAVVKMVNWSECRRHPVLVFFDHYYIFFALKYFPDNYASCRLYEKPRHEWKYYYGRGYDPLAIAKRNQHVRRPECAVLFEDKEVCHALCRSFLLPQPRHYGVLAPGDDLAGMVKELFRTQGARRVFIKPVDGDGGRGTCVAQRESGQIVIRQVTAPRRAVPVERFALTLRSVLQEGVEQHTDLSQVYRNALNTLRVATLYTPEREILVVGAILRIGSGSNFVDNGGQGGLAAPVDLSNGRLAGPATDYVGRPFAAHPDTGFPFAGFALPHWEDTLELAREVQRHFASFNRFIGMDIGISADGPVLIELNDIFGSGLFEAVNGPLLRNDEVRRCFLRYDLITHRKFA